MPIVRIIYIYRFSIPLFRTFLFTTWLYGFITIWCAIFIAKKILSLVYNYFENKLYWNGTWNKNVSYIINMHGSAEPAMLETELDQ